MTGDGPKIVIEGTREDWPGGPRTLTPGDPSRKPNRQTDKSTACPKPRETPEPASVGRRGDQ